MTYQELTKQIVALPRNERLALMTVIINTLQDEARTEKAEKAVPSFSSLAGILKGDGPAPTDEEVDQMRYDAIIGTHS